MSQEATADTSGWDNLQELDPEKLQPVTGVVGFGNHGNPDMIETGGTRWAVITQTGDLATDAAFSDPELSQDGDRLLARTRIYKAIGLAFMQGTTPLEPTHLGLHTFNSLIDKGEAIDRGMQKLELDELALSAQSLVTSMRDKRHEAFVQRVNATNSAVTGVAEVAVRLFRKGDQVVQSRIDYISGKPPIPAEHDRLARLIGFLPVKMESSREGEGRVDAFDVVMADQDGTVGTLPSGYRLYGPYMQVVPSDAKVLEAANSR